MSIAPATRTLRPFLPADLRRERPGLHIERAAYVAARYELAYRAGRSQIGVENMAREMWPDDLVTPRIASPLSRAAVTPTMTTNTSALAPNVVADFVASLIPVSAAAKLIGAGLQLSLDGVNERIIPHRASGLPDADLAWVGEGLPMPVKQYTLGAAVLGPVRKLASAVVLTRETVEHASGQEVVGTLLREDAALSLDASLFSTAAASSVRRPVCSMASRRSRRRPAAAGRRSQPT